MGFSTLGKKTAVKTRKEESYFLTQGFTGSVALSKGAIVKYNATTGFVEPVVALTDVPFGMVVAGSQKAEEDVTVSTQYQAMVYGIADGAIAAGAKVGVSAYNTTAGMSEYKTQVTGNFVIGTALTAAADEETVLIGVHRTFGEVV